MCEQKKEYAYAAFIQAYASGVRVCACVCVAFVRGGGYLRMLMVECSCKVTVS